MKFEQTKYTFNGVVWRHQETGGWHFVTLPKIMSKKIRKLHGSSEEGWGRLKVIAEFKEAKWETAIWYDTKHESYILPIKATIRKKENINDGDKLNLNLLIEKDIWKI